jgi:hypothetical protein
LGWLGSEGQIAEVGAGWEYSVDQEWLPGFVDDPVWWGGEEANGLRGNVGALDAHLLKLRKALKGRVETTARFERGCLAEIRRDPVVDVIEIIERRREQPIGHAACRLRAARRSARMASASSGE